MALLLIALIACRCGFCSFLDKRTKIKPMERLFLPHMAFALQKLATQVRAAQACRHFLAQSFSIGGLCALLFSIYKILCLPN